MSDMRDRIAAAIMRRWDEDFVCASGSAGGAYALADAVIAELQPVLEAEYDRGYDEGLDWLNDERRWIKETDDE